MRVRNYSGTVPAYAVFEKHLQRENNVRNVYTDWFQSTGVNISVLFDIRVISCPDTGYLKCQRQCLRTEIPRTQKFLLPGRYVSW